MPEMIRVDPGSERRAKNYVSNAKRRIPSWSIRTYRIGRTIPDDDANDTLQSRMEVRIPVKPGSDASIGGARSYHYFRE